MAHDEPDRLVYTVDSGMWTAYRSGGRYPFRFGRLDGPARIAPRGVPQMYFHPNLKPRWYPTASRVHD